MYSQVGVKKRIEIDDCYLNCTFHLAIQKFSQNKEFYPKDPRQVSPGWMSAAKSFIVTKQAGALGLIRI